MKRIERIANWLEPIFRDNLWYWHIIGVPNRFQIAKTLKALKNDVKIKGREQVETGRLMAQNSDGDIRYYLSLDI